MNGRTDRPDSIRISDDAALGPPRDGPQHGYPISGVEQPERRRYKPDGSRLVSWLAFELAGEFARSEDVDDERPREVDVGPGIDQLSLDPLWRVRILDVDRATASRMPNRTQHERVWWIHSLDPEVGRIVGTIADDVADVDILVLGNETVGVRGNCCRWPKPNGWPPGPPTPVCTSHHARIPFEPAMATHARALPGP